MPLIIDPIQEQSKFPVEKKPSLDPKEKAIYSDVFSLQNAFRILFLVLDATFKQIADYINSLSTGVPEAPIDGTTYGRKNAAWVSVGSSSRFNITPDYHPNVPASADDEFEFGTTLDTTGARFAGALAWTKSAYNSGTTTDLLTGGALRARNTSTGQTIFRQAIASPTTAWKFRAKMAIQSASGFANADQIGIHAYNSVNTKWSTLHFLYNNANMFETARWTAATFSSAATYKSYIELIFKNWVYFELEYDGTNLIKRFSMTGLEGSFETLQTETIATWMLLAPTHIGLHIQGSASNNVLLCCDWFRRIS